MTSYLRIDPSPAIDDQYELSPMQQGMLYHTIESSRSMYCVVVSYRINGPLDVNALGAAWQQVVERHPALRTAFQWQQRESPAQLVHRHVTLPIVKHDWRSLTPGDQWDRLTELLESEKQRGFDVTAPPLLRLTLVRCGEDVHELVVAHHHLILDGSCKTLLFAEVFRIYQSIVSATPLDLDAPQPYRRFIEWLRERDLAGAERFWRGELAGFTEPTPLWPACPAETEPQREYEERRMTLDDELSNELRQFARRRRLTLNTLIVASWALVLARTSNRQDVLFGTTVNAKPPSLDGVESMLGLFINTLPVRVAVRSEVVVSDWLRDLQLRLMDAREYDFAPLSSIQRWSDVPRRLPLFESIVVFENNLGYGSESERYGDLDIENVRANIRNSLPLTLRCVPARIVTLQLLYDTQRFSRDTVSTAEALLTSALSAVTRADAPVGALLQHLESVQHRREQEAAAAFHDVIRSGLSRARGRRRSSKEPL